MFVRHEALILSFTSNFSSGPYSLANKDPFNELGSREKKNVRILLALPNEDF